MVIASAPFEQSEVLSLQLLPITFRLRRITFLEPSIWMCPLIVAEPPQAPRIVLFEPIVTSPEIVPLT